jgi:hypothetical protein
MPVEPTVATTVEPPVHVPPVEPPSSEVVVPGQSVAVPVIDGVAVTVTLTVAEEVVVV